jgi:hypothetical protein
VGQVANVANLRANCESAQFAPIFQSARRIPSCPTAKLGVQRGVLGVFYRRDRGPAFRSAACPLLRWFPRYADPNRDRNCYCDRNGQRDDDHYAASFPPKRSLTGPAQPGRPAFGTPENAPAPTSAEIDSAKTAGKVSDYARGIIPSSALITIDAMPTGIITFHPMFMSWS